MMIKNPIIASVKNIEIIKKRIDKKILRGKIIFTINIKQGIIFAIITEVIIKKI